MFGLTKPSSIQKQFAAVHVITEYDGHYNLLVEHTCAQDIVDYIKSQMGDEFYCIYDWFVTAESVIISNQVTDLINAELS